MVIVLYEYVDGVRVSRLNHRSRLYFCSMGRHRYHRTAVRAAQCAEETVLRCIAEQMRPSSSIRLFDNAFHGSTDG
jgi:hypothetical protein